MNTELEHSEGCPECGSDNVDWETCHRCSGDGEVPCDECEGDNEDCSHCYGEGAAECLDCWGNCEWEVCQDCGAEID